MPGKEWMQVRIAILGKDKRFECLRELLAEYELTDDLLNAELTITPWPAPAELTGNNAIVTCGPANSPEWATDLLLDEDYQHDIAWMTAEGAIASAMGENNHALYGTKCMVVGWGRIGKALAVRLAALGGEVNVLSRRESVRHEIEQIGALWELTDNADKAIQGCKYVFSTPPFMVIDRKVLAKADSDAVIIDLASPPYGMDMDAAIEFGINARREPGLPGRYCAKNAGRAIYDALIRHGILKGASKNG